mmetsp:Transcript_1376/g.3058  ORF Transcript_1376/g.3058 Transcript_1376/m.3058 type:complete len:375 (+) Transcript_1376:64-1188(+)
MSTAASRLTRRINNFGNGLTQQQSFGLQVGAAAVAAGVTAVVGYYRYHKNGGGNDFEKNQRQRLEIPSELIASPYGREIKVAVELALTAGRNMVGYLDAKGTETEKDFDLGIECKSNATDFCTKVDLENEHKISNGIKLHFPTHNIIGEEEVGTSSIPALHPSTPTWIIDPIDGTTNFNAGLSSLTCVSIGFCHPTDIRRHSGGNELRNRPVMGVVYAPGSNDLYLAIKGYGAYRNGVKIYQEQESVCKTLQQAVVCCEFGYSRKQDEVDAMLGAVSKIMMSGCRAIRQLGSGVLDLCFVACGRLDVVYSGIVNEGWKPWDYCAGLVICQEAGCCMETIDQDGPDQDFDLYGTSVIAAVSRELIDETRLVINFY